MTKSKAKPAAEDRAQPEAEQIETPWYRAEQKPAYTGPYERQQPDGSVVIEQWSGHSDAWFTPQAGGTYERAIDNLPWRGLTQPQ